MQPLGRNEPGLLLRMCCELCDVFVRAKAKLQRNVYLRIHKRHNLQLTGSMPARICVCTGRLWEDSDPGCNYCLLRREGKERGAYFSLSSVWLSIISLMALSVHNMYNF